MKKNPQYNIHFKLKIILHVHICFAGCWPWLICSWLDEIISIQSWLYKFLNISKYILVLLLLRGLFSSPCQRQCELLPSLGVCRPNESKLKFCRKHLWKVLYVFCSKQNERWATDEIWTLKRKLMRFFFQKHMFLQSLKYIFWSTKC